MKKIAILQSNYIPWKGYFNIIDVVDEFIFYDEVQYTKNDWRNRNQIVTPNGLLWLTIPIKHVSLRQKINETQVLNDSWRNKHLSNIRQFYKNAPYYRATIEFVAEIYETCSYENLSDINIHFIKMLNNFIGITTKLSRCEDYGLIEGKTERLVDLVKKANGTEYVSGPAAKSYINEKLFEEEDIKLTWMDYSNYPKYQQLNESFFHGVSILDTIFNTGMEIKKYLQSEPSL
jgi:hypothetical protein